MPRPHNYYLRTVYDEDEDVDDFELEVEDPKVEDTSEAEIMNSIQLEKFGGGDENATAWLAKYRQYAVFMNWTPERQTAGFPFLLTNTASVWYDNLDERVKTRGFEDVARAFLERFNEQNQTDVSLFKIQQLPGESAEQYVTRFLKQAQKVNCPEHVQVGALLNGLSGSIKNYVNMKEQQSVEQVRRYAVLAEKKCTSDAHVESLHAKFDEMTKQIKQFRLNSLNVNSVQRTQGQNQRNYRSQSRPILGRYSYPHQSNSEYQCTRCGMDCWGRRNCPAQNQTCRKNKVEIDFSSETMTIPGNKLLVCTLHRNLGLVRPLKTVVIEPESSVRLNVSVSRQVSGNSVLLEPTSALANRQLLGARCLVKVHKGCAAMEIMNPTNNKRFLSSQLVIATVSDVHQESIVDLDANSRAEKTVVANISSDNSECIEFDLEKCDLTVMQKRSTSRIFRIFV